MTSLTNPVYSKDEAARKISDYLDMLIAITDLQLTFAVTAGAGDPDSDREHPPTQPVASTSHPAAPAIAVEFTGPDTTLLLARNGELLHSIEHLAAKLLRLEPEDHDRISFDAENFKADRDNELTRSAELAIEQVRSTGQPFAFAPMSSRERRMLHLILTRSGLPTASSGEAPRRFVVLYPEGFATPAQPVPGFTANGSRSLSRDAAERTQAIRSRFRRRS